MNNKKFDSLIKKSLADLNSPVPGNMWKRIQAEKDFDPSIKKTLDNYDSPVPTDMWQRIQSEKKKKRRPIIWWWAAAASLFLFLGTGTTWYLTKKASTVIGTKSITKIITPSANDARAAKTSAPITKSSPNTTASSQDLTKKDTTNVTSTVISTLPNNGDKNDKTANNQSSSNKTPVIQTVKNRLPNNKTNNEIAVNKKQLNIVNKSNTKTQNENNILVPDKNQFSTNTNVADNNTINQRSKPFILQGNNAENEKFLSLNQLISASFAKEKMMPKQLMGTSVKTTVIACPPLGKPDRNDWYIETFISPDIMLKSIQDKPFGKNIKSGMDSTLHQQVSFSAGINVVKSLGENWLAKTGVQYTQINELFKYSSINETRTTTVITVRTVIVSPGDTIFIRDTSSVQTIGSITKQTQNHYKQWDVPLIFSYEFGGQDLRLNANFGVVANIRSSYQGNMLDTLQKSIDISNYNNTGIYKTNIGLGVYVGLGVLKPLTDYIDLLIEPHARFNLSNMTTSSAIFNQKNTILGLSVGLRYKLNDHRQR